MPPNKDQILAALPSLSQEALQAIKTAAEGLLNRGQGNSPPQNNSLAWLYEALQATLGVRYGPAWLESPAGKRFRQASLHIDLFLSAHFPEVVKSRTATTAMMRWIIEMIIKDLRKRDIVVGAGTITQQFSRVRTIFENEFPGYINSGLASKIAEHILEREPYQ